MHSAWRKHPEKAFGVDIDLAIRKGLTFYQTRSNAIILQRTFEISLDVIEALNLSENAHVEQIHDQRSGQPESVMVRKGWTAMDVPSGMVQVLRGARPPSQRWPPAKRNVVTESRGQRQVAPRFQQVGSGRGPAPSPEEVMERARVRVAQLELAVQLLDVEDPALPPLREALMKARAQASAPTLTD